MTECVWSEFDNFYDRHVFRSDGGLLENIKGNGLLVLMDAILQENYYGT